MGFDPDVPHAPPGMQNPSLGLAEAEPAAPVQRADRRALPDARPLHPRGARQPDARRAVQRTGPDQDRRPRAVRRLGARALAADGRRPAALAGEVDVVGSPEDLAANVVDAVRLPSESVRRRACWRPRSPP
ncbi:hypothetical protein G5V59_14620 [Nocardioides sp. W3-2-3]|nr:hypothetical protein [Nocardioides convexus]